MRFLLKTAVGVFGIALILLGWGFWSSSGHAPKPIAALFDQTNVTILGNDPLTRCDEPGVGSPEFIGFRHCFHFGNARQFKGIYIEEFEGSRFLESASPGLVYRPEDSVSLTFDEQSDLGAVQNLLAGRRNDRSRIFEIDFVGRKGTVPAGTSFIGLQDKLVVVDKVQSARLLKAYPGYVPDSVLLR